MRVYSLVLVLVLTLVAGVVYANGATGTTGTTESMGTESTTTTTTTESTGTTCVPAPGPTTTTSTTTSTMPSTAICAEAEQFNTNFVSRTYGISPSAIADLRTRHDWGTIYFVANVAAKTGRPVSEIASLAEQGMSCADIAARYNVALADLTQPVVVTTRVAGYTAEVGTMPMTRTWMSDRYGNVVLTQREDQRLKRMGYTWQDIAVAANISAQTGVPVYEVLQWVDRGLTWPQVAREYGLDYDTVSDTSNYIFSRDGAPVIMQPAPTGAGPSPGMTPSGAPVMPGTPSSVPSTSPTTPSTY